ncbi:hypothetical protein ABT034_07085 [Streptomyces sp. NPDC002773]|uniref:hypothetical protein n=1 Tax=Streptomyces sp. NPDC002773 TaxID=3154430 RepID=UPI00331AE661
MTHTARLAIGAARFMGRSSARLHDVTGRLRHLRGTLGERAVPPASLVATVQVAVPVAVAYERWVDHWSGRGRTPSGPRPGRGRPARVTRSAGERTIAWTRDGAKGPTRGAVSFHEAAENLTSVVLAVEYRPRWPGGRAGGTGRMRRRIEDELRHYAGSLMLDEATETLTEPEEAREDGPEEAWEEDREEELDDEPEEEPDDEPEDDPEDEPEDEEDTV